MIRLCFNNKFNSVIEEYSDIWKTEDNMPTCIKSFIDEVYDSRVIYELNTEKYYCSNCLKELDKDYKCPKCNKQYTNINTKYLIRVYDLKEIKENNYSSYYYVYDIYNGEVVLYKIKETIYYDNPLTIYPYKTRKLEISNAYLVRENGLNDIINKEYKGYDEIKKELSINSYIYEFLDDSFNDIELYGHTSSFLYLDNLEELKNTIYKYTNIWESKSYLKDNFFSYEHLTYFPIATKSFEYLMKEKMYYLAYDRPDQLKYDKYLKEHINFIKENNLNIDEIETFRMIKEEDLDFIKKAYICNYALDEVLYDYKVNLIKLKKYFEEKELDYNYIEEYLDYLRMAEKVGLDIKDKKVLFPKHLLEEHDKLYTQIMIDKDPKIENKIILLKDLLSINKYEDNEYIIYPAESVETMIDESREQHNCVRTYCERYSENKCQIYFMRKKENKDKSFVTIEVRDGKVVQARTKYNELPSENIMHIINTWERGLVLVSNE